MKKYLAEVESNAIEYKGRVYFVESQLGAFCYTDLQSKITRIIKPIKYDNVTALYSLSARYNNYAWFFPWQAERIMRVDLDSYEIDYIEIPYNKRILDNYGQRGNEGLLNSYPYCYYSSLVRIDEKQVFAIPSSVDIPILVNMETGEIKAYERIIDIDKERMWGGTIANEKIYMSPFEGKRLIEIDYKTGSQKSYNWPYDEYMYGGMTYYNGKIWFAPLESDGLLSFDLNSHEYDFIELKDHFNQGYSYMDIFIKDNQLWILPFQSEKILIFDFKSNTFNEIKKDKEICTSFPTELKRIESSNNLVLVSCRTGFICVYNEAEESFDNTKVTIEYSYLYKSHSYADRVASLNSIFEEEMIGLENFLYLCGKD